MVNMMISQRKATDIHTSAKVQSQIRLSANNLAPLHELVRTELIAFRSCSPSKLRPLGTLVLRSNTVDPVVGSDKVASRVAHHWNIELFERINNIFSETILVNQVLVRVLGVIKAAVNASSHVLSKAAVDIVIDFAELVRREDLDGGLLAFLDLSEGCHVGLA